jgi:hypothetical protein
LVSAKTWQVKLCKVEGDFVKHTCVAMQNANLLGVADGTQTGTFLLDATIPQMTTWVRFSNTLRFDFTKPPPPAWTIILQFKQCA